METSTYHVGRAIMTLEKLRELNVNMTTATALVFLSVASKPGLEIREMETLTGMTNASTSRNLLMLTERGDIARGQPGCGVVETYAHEIDLRVKKVRLTAKGKTWARAIENILTLK